MINRASREMRQSPILAVLSGMPLESQRNSLVRRVRRHAGAARHIRSSIPDRRLVFGFFTGVPGSRRPRPIVDITGALPLTRAAPCVRQSPSWARAGGFCRGPLPAGRITFHLVRRDGAGEYALGTELISTILVFLKEADETASLPSRVILWKHEGLQVGNLVRSSLKTEKNQDVWRHSAQAVRKQE